MSKQRYDDLTADRLFVEQATARLDVRYHPRSSMPPARAMQLIGIAIVSMLILIGLPAEQRLFLSKQISTIVGGDTAPQQLAAQANPPGDYQLIVPPSVTPAQIDQILDSYRSPAVGTGQIFYDLGAEYGIDPAFAVAFFIMESSAGSDPGWAGIKADGTTTHNVGNIICAGYQRCYKGHRDYPSWEEGIKDWYRLILKEYIEGRGLNTIGEVLPIYCPFSDGCRPDRYETFVHETIDRWRGGNLP